jgi:hypothetical protein
MISKQRLSFCCCVLIPFKCSLRKSRLRLFPLGTAPIVRCVVAPTAAAQGLPTRGRAITREVKARDAPRGVSAVPLLVAEALEALALQRALSRHIIFYRDPQTAESGEGSNLGHLWAPRHRHDKMGVGDGPSSGPGRGGRIGAA